MQNIFQIYNFPWKYISYILTYMLHTYVIMWDLSSYLSHQFEKSLFEKNAFKIFDNKKVFIFGYL